LQKTLWPQAEDFDSLIIIVVIGIFAKTFVRPTVTEVFHAVAKHHLRCVHFNFACAGLPSLPDEIDPALTKRVRKAAAEHRLAIAGVSATFNMIHPDAARRKDGLHKLGVMAGACEHLGTSLMTLCTGTRDPEDMWRHHPQNDSPEAWHDLVVSMTKALTIADKHGLTLGIEPETGNVVSSARHARRLLDELRSPRLKIVIDPANLFRPGDLPRMEEILDEAFDLLGADLVMAHAKELASDDHADSRALGTGVLDWDRYLALLRKVKFDGPLILHGFEERDAARSVKFLRDRMDA
jgi:sugar phosphate isomerase/epimerase